MSSVYFIKPVGMDGPIKVGCSRLPPRRVLQLNVWSPFPLELICQLPGGIDVERRFHASMMQHWSHSEWFHATPEVLAIVEGAKRGEVPDAAPKRLRSPAYANMPKHHYERCGMKLRLKHAKRHALGWDEAHRTRFAEEVALDVAAAEGRFLTRDETRALLNLAASLRAMPRHPRASFASAKAA